MGMIRLVNHLGHNREIVKRLNDLIVVVVAGLKHRRPQVPRLMQRRRATGPQAVGGVISSLRTRVRFRASGVNGESGRPPIHDEGRACWRQRFHGPTRCRCSRRPGRCRCCLGRGDPRCFARAPVFHVRPLPLRQEPFRSRGRSRGHGGVGPDAPEIQWLSGEQGSRRLRRDWPAMDTGASVATAIAAATAPTRGTNLRLIETSSSMNSRIVDASLLTVSTCSPARWYSALCDSTSRRSSACMDWWNC